MIVSIDRIARVVNFPRFDMPAAVTEAVDKINKRNLVLNLWQILQDEKAKEPKNRPSKTSKKDYKRRKSTIDELKSPKRNTLRLSTLRRDSKILGRTTSML